MTAIYDKLGIQFQYPENWTLDEGQALTEHNSVSVYSPDEAFWSVMIYPPTEDPAKLAADVLSAMRGEYDNLDAEAAQETVAGHRLLGYDMNFYCLDLTNTAMVRSLSLPQHTLVIHFQALDQDFDGIEPVFRAITTSLLGNLPG